MNAKKIVKFKVVLVFLIVTFTVLACSDQNKQRGYKIEKEKLIEIIIDHQVAKAAAFKYPVNLRDSISKVYYQQIYTIHDVDQYVFEHDLNKLESDPAYYKEIYDAVNHKIKELQYDEPE